MCRCTTRLNVPCGDPRIRLRLCCVVGCVWQHFQAVGDGWVRADKEGWTHELLDAKHPARKRRGKGQALVRRVTDKDASTPALSGGC